MKGWRARQDRARERMSAITERDLIRRAYYDAIAQGKSLEQAADIAHGRAPISTNEDEDMPYKRGTPEHKAYWANRRNGMTTHQAIAAVEAQTAPVADETAVEATESAEPVAAAPEPSEGSGQRMAGPPHDIPDDWRDLPWPRLRSLAASVSDTPIHSRDDCERAIEGEIERRSA